MSSTVLDLLERFNAAFNRHDVDEMMALMTDDCVFENTDPAPDGTRYEGQVAVRRFWEEFFTASPLAYIAVEDVFASDERGTQTWRYTWGDGHVRGADVFHFREGKIAAKLSYVKG